MKSTNYTSTFLQVADDCPVTAAEPPPTGGEKPTVAAVHYALLVAHPYEFTSDDLLFEADALRRRLPPEKKAAARTEFFAKERACLRSSPLGKRYGWGIHFDATSRVALVALGSPEYDDLAADASLKHIKALRSRRV